MVLPYSSHALIPLFSSSSSCLFSLVNNKKNAVTDVTARVSAGFNLAVVTTGDYTKSAHELAEANSVKLLSHHDIPRFDDIFST